MVQGEGFHEEYAETGFELIFQIDLSSGASEERKRYLTQLILNVISDRELEYIYDN